MTIYKNILIAVDFSDVCPLVVQRGEALAEVTASKVTLLHVFENVATGIEAFGETAGLMIPNEIQEQQVSEAKERLNHLADEIKLIPNTDAVVLEGLPASTICEYASSQNVDLIVMGHNTKSGLLGFLLGSTAETVMKQAHCDVLIVRAPKAEKISA